MRLNEQHNPRLAPAEAVTLRYEGRAAAGTNAPQTMRVWPGLRLVGAGGKVSKGCFVTVAEAGPESVKLETREALHARGARGSATPSLTPAARASLRAAPPVRRRLELLSVL